MSSSSRSTAALTGFIVGSVLTLLGVWITTELASKKKESNNNMRNNPSSVRSPSVALPSDIRQEQLSRHTLYFGQEGMLRLKNASIVVVGVGGVGSHVAHMVRSDPTYPKVCHLVRWPSLAHSLSHCCTIARTRRSGPHPSD
jgi:hypothetical protein